MKVNQLFHKSIQSWDKVFKLGIALAMALSIISFMGYISVAVNILALVTVLLALVLIIKEDKTNPLSLSDYIITETFDSINIGDLPGVNKSDLMLAISKYEEYKQGSKEYSIRGLFDIAQVRYLDRAKTDIVVDIIPNTQSEVVTGYITIHQEDACDYIEIAKVRYYVARLDGNSYPFNNQLDGKLCTIELLKPKVIPDSGSDKHLGTKLPYMQKLQEWGVLEQSGKPVQHWGILSKLELVGEN